MRPYDFHTNKSINHKFSDSSKQAQTLEAIGIEKKIYNDTVKQSHGKSID